MQFHAERAANPTWTISQGSPPGWAGAQLDRRADGNPDPRLVISLKVTATSGSDSDTQTYSMSVVAPLAVDREGDPR